MTGQPHPEILQKAFQNLLEGRGFNQIYNDIFYIMRERGISLNSILKDLTKELINYNLNEKMRAKILIRMAEIEYRLSLGCTDRKQLGSLVGVFMESRVVGF